MWLHVTVSFPPHDAPDAGNLFSFKNNTVAGKKGTDDITISSNWVLTVSKQCPEGHANCINGTIDGFTSCYTACANEMYYCIGFTGQVCRDGSDHACAVATILLVVSSCNKKKACYFVGFQGTIGCVMKYLLALILHAKVGW